MRPNLPREGHNVRVTPTRRARPALVAAALAALLLSGCGGGSSDSPKAKPSADLPTGNVKIPDGVTLTKAGSELAFKEKATVAYEPNTQRSSVLELSVDSVQQGRIADFAAYQMDAATKRSHPYYVRVTVKNVGTGNLGRAAVPLFAVNSSNALVQPSSFNNTFTKCPSKPLPATFGQGQSVKGCLAYLIPAGGTLTAMSFRPLQAFEPITWEGTVVPPATKKKKASAKKAGGKKAGKKAGAAKGTP
jgi:hypothetical protein